MKKTAMLLLLALTACSLTEKPKPQNPENLPLTAALKKEIEESSRLFRETLERISEHYYASVVIKSLTERAIQSMIEQLNDHGLFEPAHETVFCPPESCEGNPGMGITRLRGALTVTRVAPRSSAFFEGVEIGDIILSVEGKSVQLLSLKEAAFLIRCGQTPEVNVTFLNRGWVVTKTLRKGKVSYKDFLVMFIPPDIGYFYVGNVFERGIAERLVHIIITLKEQGVGKIILDLRSMTGGNLYEGLFLVSAFLPPSTPLLTTVSETRGETRVYSVPENARPLTGPLVVLTNRLTSSTGEIIAMALKENQRATLIGEKTSGYGTIIGPFHLPDDSTLYLPTSLYYGPAGNSIEGIGVEPHIVIEETNPVAHYVPGVQDKILETALETLKNSDALTY